MSYLPDRGGMDNKLNQPYSETQWKSVNHYDMEICGVCHGEGHIDLSTLSLVLWVHCYNCQDSPSPGYIVIPKPEFRPDEKE